MDTKKTCSSCQEPLTPNAPDGLCPACLMKAGAGTGVDIGPDSQGENGRTSFDAPTLEEVARLFPQLEILSFIGQGGMGAVYKARQGALDRIVALKILPPGIGGDPAFAQRFTREAKALAKLNHPGIVTLYEFGQADGLFYFLMEFVDGVNLRQLLEAGCLSPREALAIVPQICDALQYAHDQGIVHRDIKPENILLDRQGRVKVADFGLAKLVGTDAPPSFVVPPPGGPDRLESELQAVVLTEAGKVMGTPQYMAPEQRDHPTEVDHRADIYSLGVVFYQMLTGELPGKPIEVPSSRMRGMQIDVRLDEIVLRALEKEPARRYQQVSEVKTMVESISNSSSPVTGTAPSPARPAATRGRLRAALIVGVLVWLFVTGTVTLITWIRAESWKVVAVISCPLKWRPGRPVEDHFRFTATMIELIRSDVILGRVVDRLQLDERSGKLDERWGKRNLGLKLTKAQTMVLLKRRLDVRSEGGSLVQVGVFGKRPEEPEEAMDIANTIAEELRAFRIEQHESPADMLEMTLRYTAPDILLGIAAGFVLGLLAGGLVLWRGFLRRESQASQVKTAVETIDQSCPPPDANPQPADWRTWGPFQSRQVREICDHMTEAERRELNLRGALFGIWNAATFFVPWGIFLFVPKPVNWIFAPIVLLVGLAFYPLWRRMMREFLASTIWARQQGIAPESLPMSPRIILVGRRGDQAVIHWPGVLLRFVLTLALAEAGAIFASTALVGHIDGRSVGIGFVFAVIFTGILVRRGLRTPVEQLTALDGPAGTGPPADWRTWSPSQSQQVREICAHMTEAERREWTLRGAFFGIWNAATFFVPCGFAFFAPKPLNWIFAPIVLLLGLAFYPLWRRITREFLASTRWARQQGIAPESLDQAVIHWPNVLLSFVLILVFVEAGADVATRILMGGGIDSRTAGFLFMFAVIFTGMLVLRGLTTPVEKLTHLDGPGGTGPKWAGRKWRIPLVGIGNGPQVIHWPGLLRFAVIFVVAAGVFSLIFYWLAPPPRGLVVGLLVGSLLLALKLQQVWTTPIERLPRLDAPERTHAVWPWIFAAVVVALLVPVALFTGFVFWRFTAKVETVRQESPNRVLEVRCEGRKAYIQAELDDLHELRLTIGSDALGWSSQHTGSTSVTATVEASSQIKMEDGSMGRGLIFQAWGTRHYIAITPEGPVPYGDVVFRPTSRANESGSFTFADIRQADGTLIPVSIRVRPVSDRSPGSQNAGPVVDIAVQPGGPWTARLPSGVTVELLGAAENPSLHRPWWRPDGSPLESAPYDFLGVSVANEQGKMTREIAVRLRNLAAPVDVQDVQWQFDPLCDSSGRGMPTRLGTQVADLRAIAVRVPATKPTITIRVRLTTGKRQTGSESRNTSAWVEFRNVALHPGPPRAESGLPHRSTTKSFAGRVNDMVEQTRGLLEKGLAYEKLRSIYYRISSSPDCTHF